MPLFKSRAQRRMERELEVRRGLNMIRRNIRDLERNEKDYLKKARRSRSIGANEQLHFLKATLKRTSTQRKLLERQLLNIETALQIKNQAESHSQFARSMQSVSRAIQESFGRTDFLKTQAEFEQALSKAESLERQMEIFLEVSSQSLANPDLSSDSQIVSDQEIDQLIEADPLDEERDELDDWIEKGLVETRREIGGQE